MARCAKKRRPPGRPQVEEQCERHRRHHDLLLREPNVDRNQWPAGANGPRPEKVHRMRLLLRELGGSAADHSTSCRQRQWRCPVARLHYKGIEERSCDSEPILWVFAPFENRKIAMRDEPSPEEIERQRREHKRDMRRIVWILLPITTFFFLLLVIQRFGLSP